MGRGKPLVIGSPWARRSDIAAPCSNAVAFCHLDYGNNFWQKVYKEIVKMIPKPFGCILKSVKSV
jgi:hypothetical protein